MHWIKTLILLLLMLPLTQCGPGRRTAPAGDVVSDLVTNPNGRGQTVILEVPAGPSMNYPLMAVWLEDLGGNYLQTLYVAQSIATGTFRHGKQVKGHWEPGERRRPAALPRWGHQRGLQASDGLYLPEPSQPVPDAYTGATPTTAFRLKAKADQPLEHPVRIFLEINQSWDWNTFWTNAKYPGDEAYATSSQPAVVYSAVLDPSRPGEKVGLSLAGRSHHSGTDGLLYKDVETLSTALQIIGEASARIVD